MNIDHLYIQQMNENFFVIKNTINNKYVKLGKRELKFLLEIKNIKDTEFDLENESNLNSKSKELLRTKFEEWKFIGDGEIIDQSIKKQKRFSNLTMIHIISIKPEIILNKIYPYISFLFGKIGLLLLLSVILIPYLLFSKYPYIIGGAIEEANLSFNFFTGLILLMAICITNILHEFGHAIVCKKYGGQVSSMGIVLFYLMPSLYCDVSDIYIINKKNESVQVAIAGICINLFLGHLAAIAYVIFYIKGNNYMFLMIYYFSNLGLAFYNMIPFVKYDGYWIMSALLKVNNLMDKGVLLFILMSCNFKKYTNLKLRSTKKYLLTVYGFICIVFKPIFWGYCISLIVSSIGKFTNNKVTILIMCGLVLIIILDLKKELKKYINLYKSDKDRILAMI